MNLYNLKFSVNLFHFYLVCINVFLGDATLIRESEGWTIEPAAPWVLPGGSLILQLQPLEEISPINTQCYAVSPGEDPFVLSANETTQEFVVKDGYPDRVTIGITSIGRCFTLHSSITDISNGYWRIIAYDKFVRSTNIIVLSNPSSHATVTTSIGRLASISCSSSTTITLFYCQILNNTGHVVSRNCFHTINPVRKEHVGNWTCLMAFRGTMVETKYVVSLVLQENDHLEGKVITENNKTRLQCSLMNSSTRFNWCRATSPTGDTFLLSPGLVHGKYSAIGISPEDRTCSLVIDSVSSSDHGLWRIELGLTVDDYTGCFINLPHNNEIGSANVNSEPSQTVVKVGENLRLECKVPWPSSYCYAIKPDGTPIKQNNNNGDRLLKIGVCILTATNLRMEDAGRWTCGLSAFDGTEDVHFYTDVEVMSGALAPLETGLRLVSGSPAILLCRSPIHQPLKYCRFTNPHGKGFLFRPNIFPESRFSYYGAGLDEGECGVQISEVINEDIGSWICASTFVSSNVEEYTTITVVKIEPSLGYKIGVGIGSSALIAALIAGVIFGYRKRKARQNDERRLMLGESHANSTERISYQVNGEHGDRVGHRDRVVATNNGTTQRVIIQSPIID